MIETHLLYPSHISAAADAADTNCFLVHCVDDVQQAMRELEHALEAPKPKAKVE